MRLRRALAAVVSVALLVPAGLLATSAQAAEDPPRISVARDLLSVARWKSENENQSLTALYTLESAGGNNCENFAVETRTKSLHFPDDKYGFYNQLSNKHCQLGHGSGTGDPRDWDYMILLTWGSEEACLANTQLLFGIPDLTTTIGVTHHSEPGDCTQDPHTRQFALPVLTQQQVQKDNQIPVTLGMNLESPGMNGDQFQGKTIGYWTLDDDQDPKRSGVIDVVHYAEPNGQVASVINIKGNGACKDGDKSSDGYWCVVGNGYDPQGASSWNNTFRVKLDGTASENPSVWIGKEVAGAKKVATSNKSSCPSGIGNPRANEKTLCLALNDDTAAEVRGELFLYLQDDDSGERVPFAVWDFDGQPNDGIWGQEPAEGYDWLDYHILSVQEGVSSGTFNEESTDFTDYCIEWETFLPTVIEPDDCQQHGVEVRAIFDWKNDGSAKSLEWLWSVRQFGSRSVGGEPAGYANPSPLNTSGRIPNQLASGNYAFYGLAGQGGDAFDELDVSNLKYFTYMFRDAENFNQDISDWTVENALQLDEMFQGATVFNQPIGSWKVDNVRNFSYMFREAKLFNQDLTGWSNRLYSEPVMSGMFNGAASFDQDLSDWNVSRVTDMTGMFEGAISFNQDLSSWNVERINRELADLFDSGATSWVTPNDWCNNGRPIWGTDGSGCSLVLTVDHPKKRVILKGDGDVSNYFEAQNAFLLSWPNFSDEVASRSGDGYELKYSIRENEWKPVTFLGTPVSDVLVNELRQGEVPFSAASPFAEPTRVDIHATQDDMSAVASGFFDVFAPCKADGDVNVSVQQVGESQADAIDVKVTLEVDHGVVPPGTVTLTGTSGFPETSISVTKWDEKLPRQELSATIEFEPSFAPTTMSDAELVQLVIGNMVGTFKWGQDQGDEGPKCVNAEQWESSSVSVPFEMLVSEEWICEVLPELEQLQRELATPGTTDVTVSAQSGGVQGRAGDVDGDGVANENDPDIDGDGMPNESDSDIDGDGTPNVTDPDIDGDGIANAGDDFPKGPPPVARPMPIGLTEAEREALLEQFYGEQVPVTYPVPGDDYAEGAGQIVVGPDPEIVVDLAVDRVRDAGEGLDCGGDIIDPDPDFGWPVDPGPDGDSGPGDGSGSGSGSGGPSGDSGSGSAGGLRVALATPAEAFKGVPAELEATVTPSTTDGVVEFAVREIDLNGEETVRILGSAPVVQERVTVDGQTVTVARASLDLVPQDYGDAIVYARVTEKDSGAQDVAARAAVVNPAPFADNFSLTVGGDAWLPVETGNVLGYGYSPVEFTTMTGEAPRITTPVNGPCQVLSTRSIPPQIRMLGTAIAPKRCSFTVTTPGGGAYAPVNYTYDVALSMGTQTATLAADKAKKTIKKGSMVTVAKKTQTKTDEDYKLTGKKINWSVTSGKDVCAVKTSASGKVSVKGTKKGTCTVRAKAPKVKGKYKSFTEFYNFRVK